MRAPAALSASLKIERDQGLVLDDENNVTRENSLVISHDAGFGSMPMFIRWLFHGHDRVSANLPHATEPDWNAIFLLRCRLRESDLCFRIMLGIKSCPSRRNYREREHAVCIRDSLDGCRCHLCHGGQHAYIGAVQERVQERVLKDVDQRPIYQGLR
jgi:hypothetical protein